MEFLRGRRSSACLLATLVPGALVLPGCGASRPGGSTSTIPADQEAEAIERRPALKAQFQRELTSLPTPTQVRGTGWAAEVPAEAPTVETLQAGEQELLVLPIGTSTPITCNVFAKPTDPAATLLKAVQGPTGQDVETLAVRALEPLVGGRQPVLLLERQYLAPGRGGVKHSGHLLAAMVAHPARPVLCRHEEAGYRQTFRKVVSALAENYQVDGYRPPTVVTVEALHAEGVPIGTTTTRSWQRGGKAHTIAQSARFFPSSKTALLAEDSVSHAATKAGQLVEGVWVESTNGKIELELKVGPRQGTAYPVVGQVDGRPIRGSIRAPEGIPSEARRQAKLRELVGAGQPFSFEWPEYVPSREPLALITVKYRRQAGDPPRQVQALMGDVKLTGRVSPDGRIEAAEIHVNDRVMELRTLHHSERREAPSREGERRGGDEGAGERSAEE